MGRVISEQVEARLQDRGQFAIEYDHLKAQLVTESYFSTPKRGEEKEFNHEVGLIGDETVAAVLGDGWRYDRLTCSEIISEPVIIRFYYSRR